MILTDKTGTLTENKIYVDTFCFPEEILKVEIKDNVLTFDKGKVEKVRKHFKS